MKISQSLFLVAITTQYILFVNMLVTAINIAEILHAEYGAIINQSIISAFIKNDFYAGRIV
jgi:hypothetical protein